MIPYRLSSWLLILLICYMPLVDMFLPKTNFGAGLPDLDATRVILAILIPFFFLETAIVRKMKGINSFVLIVLFFSLVVCFSPLWSPFYVYNTVVLQQLFNTILSPLLVLIIAISVFNKKEIMHQYMKHLVIAVCILSVISIVQMAFGSSQIHGQQRAMATMNNPNLLAVFLVFSVPCILYSIQVKNISKKIGIIVLCLVVLGVISTVSRKGAGALGLSFFLYFLLTKQFKKIAILLIISLFFGILISGYSVVSNRFSIQEFQRQFKGKWGMTVAGLQMLADKPVLGHGYNGYYESFGKYYKNSSRDKYDAHNEFVTALANFGLVGFVFFMGIFLYPLNYARKVFRKVRHGTFSEFKGLMAVIAITTIIPFMLSAFFAGTIFYQQIAVFTFYAHLSFLFAEDNLQRTS